MKSAIIVGAVAIALVGCAKSPSSIAPMAVAASDYDHLDCNQLKAEWQEASDNLESASDAQNDAQTADAITVFLVLVPASALTGDSEADVAQFKGEKLAIERAMDQKAC